MRAAPNPTFAVAVRESFAAQGALRALGAELALIEPGHCRIRVPYSEAATQHHGLFHGGVIGIAADVAGGYAAMSLCEAGMEVLTVEYKINFLAPARGIAIVAAGHVVRAGRSLLVTRMEVDAIDAEGHGHCCAVAQQTIMAVARERIGRG
jgi:uncharacterized protein (TIGR00369 family)